MERSNVVKILDKHLGKGHPGEIYEIHPHIVSQGFTTSVWEFIIVHTNFVKDIYVGDAAEKVEKELSNYLFNKYQHDDVFVHVENKFNTGLVITMYY